MNHLNELAAKLTPAQLKEVEDFAEFLVTRRAPETPAAPTTADVRPKYLNVDALVGLCAGMGGDKSSVELVHEAYQSRASKADYTE